jgi:hypothetical protein
VNLGALLTVLIVALPPFVQQSVNFDSTKVRTLDNAASIPQYSNFTLVSKIGGSFNFGYLEESL